MKGQCPEDWIPVLGPPLSSPSQLIFVKSTVTMLYTCTLQLQLTHNYLNLNLNLFDW